MHLSPESIRQHLPPALRGLTVLTHDTLDSTNTEARRLLESGHTPPFLVTARTQTAGKGRLGRSFYSPKDTGLYMTLALTLRGSAEAITAVTPTAAVATALAIEETCHRSPAIKWVNDLYLKDRKICGILTEAIPAEGGLQVLVGIGINLTTQAFPEGMRNPPGALLSREDPPLDLPLFCGRILTHLCAYLEPANAPACLSAYRQRMMPMGREVICSHHFAEGTPDLRGVVEGVDETYGLILRDADGNRHILRGGEITLSMGNEGRCP